MKYEWKKSEKDLYLPKSKPSKIVVPQYKYFVIEGDNLSDIDDFKDRAEVLSRVSLVIKNMPKRGFYPGGYFEYIPYPLEMLYNSRNQGYKLMIRQHEFVTSSVARMAITSVISRNPHRLINEVGFTSLEDGTCVQLTHTGENENKGIELLLKFMEENELNRKGEEIKIVFINDPMKTSPEKRKTVLRLMVE